MVQERERLGREHERLSILLDEFKVRDLLEEIRADQGVVAIRKLQGVGRNLGAKIPYVAFQIYHEYIGTGFRYIYNRPALLAGGHYESFQTLLSPNLVVGVASDKESIFPDFLFIRKDSRDKAPPTVFWCGNSISGVRGIDYRTYFSDLEKELERSKEVTNLLKEKIGEYKDVFKPLPRFY